MPYEKPPYVFQEYPKWVDGVLVEAPDNEALAHRRTALANDDAGFLPSDDLGPAGRYNSPPIVAVPATFTPDTGDGNHPADSVEPAPGSVQPFSRTVPHPGDEAEDVDFLDEGTAADPASDPAIAPVKRGRGRPRNS